VEQARDAAPESAPPALRPGSSALRTHLTLGVGLAICAAAFWIELHRALGGNELSWAYVFEWPLLGVFAVYMWWRVLHPEQRPRRSKVTATAPEYETMLAAWEEHRRTLNVEEPGPDVAVGDDPGRALPPPR
jgi:hypothetical protein